MFETPIIRTAWAFFASGSLVLFFVFVFVIVLVLHSLAFDPDTNDVPKHLKVLRILAWLLLLSCSYYNAGETREPSPLYLRTTVHIVFLVLIVGFWYIWELPKWYKQLSGSQIREWKKDDITLGENEVPEEDIERRISKQINQDYEARREMWVAQERQAFLQDDEAVDNNDQTPAPVVDEGRLRMETGYAAYRYLEHRKYYSQRSATETIELKEVIWWVDANDKTLKCISDFTDYERVCLKDTIPSLFPLWVFLQTT